MAYTRNPRKRVIRGSSSDELRRGGRRTSEELDIEGDDMPFVRLGSSVVGTGQDVVQRIGDAIIGGDFGGNARGEGAIDIQIERLDSLGAIDVTRVASGVDSVAFGRNSRASGVGSVAIGRTAFADGPYAVALGSGEARADGSFAIGGVVTAGGDYGIVLGGQATVTAQGGIAIGEISEATAAGAIAIGDNETAAGGTNAVAIGNEARAVGNYSASVGAAAGHQTDAMGDFVASGARSVAIGRLAYAGDADEAVIAATSLKMQTSRTGWNPSVFTYESVITTSASAPVTGNVATWADVDRIGDGGVALSALSPVFTNSAGLAALLSDETGYSAGALAVFSISPALTTPNLGTPSAAVLTNATGLPTAGLLDAAVTLAKMANLAQDQFIGRVTASTGVPETATVTAAARTVLDDTTVAAMVDTLGGASSVGTGGLVRATSPVFGTNISTPAIVTASGALTVTPAAGSGVNIVLSTTGDFAINTTRFVVDTSTGYSGFGTATPDSLLQLYKASGPTLKISNGANGGGGYMYFTGSGSGSEKGFSNMFYDYASSYQSLRPYSAHYILGSSSDAFVFGKSSTSTIGADSNFNTWMTLTGGNVLIGTTTDSGGKLQVSQSSTTAAIPPLRMNQADISEGFIDFIGTSAASAAGPISTWTVATIAGYVRCEINGAAYWMPFYNAPTA